MSSRLLKILIILLVIASPLFYWQRWAIPHTSVLFMLISLGCLGLAFLLLLFLPWQNPRLLKASHVLRWVCLVLGLALIISFAIVQNHIWRFAAQVRAAEPNTPCLLVLGAGLVGDIPSLILQYRLKTTLEYMQTHPQSVAVLSGGQGPRELVSEAFAMQSWLTYRGIEEERLHMEDKSTSTYENIAFSQPIIRELGYEQVLIVTNDFHLLRASMLAEHYGQEAQLLAAPTPKFFLIPPSYLREYFALVKAWLLLNIFPQSLPQSV